MKFAPPWTWPLKAWCFRNIPVGNHPGAFGAVRKYDIHTGVDLYCPHDTEIVAVQSGIVVGIEHFTGPGADDPSPWWNDTWAVLVEGLSGVVLYGELYPHVKVSDFVEPGQRIGFSRTVSKKDKGKPICMLHFELYKFGTRESAWWRLDDKSPPRGLINPTSRLLYSFANVE